MKQKEQGIKYKMKKNSFIEGTLIATIAIVLVKILGMLYVIPFYAIIGKSGGALYSYAYNIYLIFLGISSAGLPSAISKIISEYNALGLDDAKKRAYDIAKKMIGIISIIAFIILFTFAGSIGHFIIGDLNGANQASDIAFVIRCISPAILLIPYLSIIKGYLQGHNYIKSSSISQLIEQIVRIMVILCGSYFVLNIIKGTLTLAVGVAISGAFFGGLFAYLYLHFQMKKGNLIPNIEKRDEVSNKEIALKIIKYAIPFVIISVATNIYYFTDQILVLRTLEFLKFDPHDVEFIASSIATWSPKICMIINAMAMGLAMNIVPNIVSAITKGEKNLVELNINKSISIIIFISLPLSLGLCILSSSVWNVFYGANLYGSMILKLTVFSALLGNLYMIVTTICQSLNKYKLVYTVSFFGFLLNAILDVPIMLLFNYVNIPAYLGSVVASMIGYFTAVLYGLYVLKRENNIEYFKSFKMLFKNFIPAIAMILVLWLFNHIVKINDTTKILSIIKIMINTFIGGFTYLFISYKMNIINEIFGKELINKIIKKLTLGKFKDN